MKNLLTIFDFDGVHANSEKVFWHITSKYVMEKHGQHISEEFWNEKLKGVSSADRAKIFEEYFGFTTSLEEQIFLHDEAIKEIKKEGVISLTPGMMDFLEKCSNKCVATGGRFNGTLEKIAVLKIGKHFGPKNIFTIEHVKNGKPDPELFLLAASSMGFEPKDCVVIEDGLDGLRAGMIAGMKTIAFSYHYPQSFQMRFENEAFKIGADYVCNDMVQVAAVWEELLGK